jgi:hypothetical protein
MPVGSNARHAAVLLHAELANLAERSTELNPFGCPTKALEGQTPYLNMSNVGAQTSRVQCRPTSADPEEIWRSSKTLERWKPDTL